MKQNHILFNVAWFDAIEQLSMEQRGEFLTALYSIALETEYEPQSRLVQVLLTVCGAELKQSIDSYKKKCETNKANRTGKRKNEKTNVNHDNE